MIIISNTFHGDVSSGILIISNLRNFPPFSNPEFHNRVYKIPPSVPILSKIIFVNKE